MSNPKYVRFAGHDGEELWVNVEHVQGVVEYEGEVTLLLRIHSWRLKRGTTVQAVLEKLEV